MKFLVTEIQTASDGTVAQITSVYDDRLHAESSYHTILAAAALSNLYMHAVIMYTSDGTSIMSGYYTHIPEPEPEPNNEEETT